MSSRSRDALYGRRGGGWLPEGHDPTAPTEPTPEAPPTSDDERKARQRAEVAAYELEHDLVPGTASHKGDGPGGGPTGGIPWVGLARMAGARLPSYGWAAANEKDREALRRHPEWIPADVGPEPQHPAPRAEVATDPATGLPVLLPEFDGATYRTHRDYERLGAQARRVWDAMSDGKPHTLAELHALTNDPEASISARLRDFRKEQWGGHEVEHRNLGAGTWTYRLLPATGV